MVQIYKPTARVTGLAISLQASDRDGKLYVNMIKQASWNEQTKKGSFIENRKKPGFYTTLKFNQAEAAGMIDAIERHYEFKAYHGTEARATQITFGPAQPKNEGDVAPALFVLRAVQTDSQDTTQKVSFFIPLTYAEARLIKEYLVHYLHKSFRIQPERRAAAPEQTDAQDQGGATDVHETQENNEGGEQETTSGGSDW